MRAGKLMASGMVLVSMLIVTFALTRPLWSGKRLLFMGDLTTSDITELNYPAHDLLAASLKKGEIPYWNQYIGCGFPQHAEGQAGLLYPPNLLLFRLLGTALAFNLSVIISLFLSLTFAYLLARHYRLSRPSSFYCAVSFTFSGFVISKLKFTYMINSIPWVPLAVYGLERSFARRNLKYLLLTSLALAMEILAGGPQVFFITMLALLPIFCWRLAGLVKSDYPLGWRALKKTAVWISAGFLVSVLLGLALSAPQLFSQTAGFPYFNRAEKMDFQSVQAIPMRPRALSLFFSPFQHGNPARGSYTLKKQLFWEDIAYPGLLTVVLALVATVFLLGKDRDVGMWLALALFFLLVALGDSTPLAEFLYKYVPGTSMFRFFQRYLVITVLGMSILAAKGMERTLAAFKPRKAQTLSLAGFILAILLLDLAFFAFNFISTIDAGRMESENRTASFLRENLDPANYRYCTLGENKVWEAAYRQADGWLEDKEPYYEYFSFLSPNSNTIYGIPGAHQYGAYGLYYFKTFQNHTFFGAVPEEGWEADLPDGILGYIAAQSVRYVVTPYSLKDDGFELRDSWKTDIDGISLNIYEYRDALPRARIFTDYEVVEDTDDLTLSQSYDLFAPHTKVRDRVILEEEPAPLFEREAGNPGEATVVYSGDHKVDIDAYAPQGGILVLSDTYYPEWHAYVDGEEREIMKANVAYRAVVLEPGRHRVEFVYKPSSTHYGMAVCAAGALFALLVLIRYKRSPLLDISRRA